MFKRVLQCNSVVVIIFAEVMFGLFTPALSVLRIEKLCFQSIFGKINYLW